MVCGPRTFAIFIGLFLFHVFAAIEVTGQEPPRPRQSTTLNTADPLPSSDGALQDVPRLKDAFRDVFLIGATLDFPRQFSAQPTLEVEIATTHFSAITLENSMKPMALQPAEGRFNFANADRFVELAEQHGAVPIGHCLVWHSQTPRWFFEGPDGQPVDRELALARMRNHIATVVGRYKGRIKEWDVVNEAISDSPGQLLRPSPWLRAIGEDYIAEAFRAAHAADPEAILIYNDYGNENRAKRQKTLQLLRDLLDQGVPVHAVGMQCHWRMDQPNLAEVEESIKQYAALGLKVMITEFDMGVLPTNYRGADISRVEGPRDQDSAMNPYTRGLPDAVARRQAERYRQAFAMFLRHKESIGRVTFWGTHDGRSWLNNFPIRGRTEYPLLFDRAGQPKPAFFAILQLMTDEAPEKTQDRPLPHTSGENPIFRDVFTADPAALVFGDTLYVYVGHDEAKDGEMFNLNEWLCYSTKDMKNWTAHGPVLRATDFEWAVRDAWASQVVERDGKFFFYTTVQHRTRGKSIGVAVSDSPTGPFVDARGTALVTDDTTPSDKPWDDIDPTVFIDDDGTPYMAWGNPYLYFAKLKPNMIEIDGPIERIDLPNYTEGPWLHKRGDIYYLTYAAFAHQGMAEKICYATAPSIHGPWTYQGILTGHAKNSYTIHPAIVEFQGQWYFFYHNAALTINGVRGALGRRAVCVEYLYYNPDGTIRPITQTDAGVSVPPLPEEALASPPVE